MTAADGKGSKKGLAQRRGAFEVKKWLLLGLTAALMAGCAVHSGVQLASEYPSPFDTAFYQGNRIEHGKNDKDLPLYRVFNQGATGFVPQSAVRSTTLRQATDFCKEKGKQVKLISERRAAGAKIAGNFPRVELVFVCEDPVERPAQAVPSNGTRSRLSKYEELEKVKQLFDQGILTQQEYQEQKQRLLKREY